MRDNCLFVQSDHQRTARVIEHHDLCLKFEVATPGEIRQGGQGWEIQAGLACSPFGQVLLASGPRGIVRLRFLEDGQGLELALRDVQRLWPQARIRREDAEAQLLVNMIFSPSRKPVRRTIGLFVRGTPYQLLVWRALIDIPPGQTTSYGALARAIGTPRGARAVGRAVGSNPISVLIPCHRVIHGTGAIGQYHGGAHRKRALLAWEQAENSRDVPRPGQV